MASDGSMPNGNKVITQHARNGSTQIGSVNGEVHINIQGGKENGQKSFTEKPIYKLSTPESFDLDELINECQCILRMKQGLVGLAVHCSSHSFLQYFKARLKVALGRNNIFTATPIILSATHTSIEMSIRLAERHLLNLRQSDVLVDVLSPNEVAATRFWQRLVNEFSSQFSTRFIVIMATAPDLSFPEGFISLTPPCFNDGHVFNWVGTVVPHLSSLPANIQPVKIMNEWTNAVMAECSVDGKLHIDFVYEHLEAALNALRLNPTVPALYTFLEERKQIYV